MPRKTAMSRRGGRRKHRVGGALPKWLSDVGSFLKKHQIISRGANALSGILPGPWAKQRALSARQQGRLAMAGAEAAAFALEAQL